MLYAKRESCCGSISNYSTLTNSLQFNSALFDQQQRQRVASISPGPGARAHDMRAFVYKEDELKRLHTRRLLNLSVASHILCHLAITATNIRPGVGHDNTGLTTMPCIRS